MFNKIVTADEAVAGVQDGMTIMVGGFLGTGSPEVLMDALVRKGVKHLTVIGNDGGLAEGQPADEFAGKTPRGIGKLLEHRMVDHVIMSHVGVNPRLNEQFAEGTLTYTLVPQGTLAEKIRAAAYGLGGVLTPVLIAAGILGMTALTMRLAIPDLRPGQTSSAEIHLGPSQHYTREDLDACVRLVREKFRSDFKGCRLDSLTYDEDFSDAYDSPYGADSLVLLSDWSTTEGCEDPSGITHAENWQWIFTRSDDGTWILRGSGYA